MIESEDKRPLSYTPEHIALNVPDPQGMVEWYKRNLKMSVRRTDGPPTHTTFLADVSGAIMLEFFCNMNVPMLDLCMLHPMSLHLAFMTDSAVGTKEALQEAGATVAEEVVRIPAGDEILMMRDPWGFALQFVQRAVPMLPQLHLRPEHLAFNVGDSRRQSEWYQTHLGMKVMRQGGAPGFGFFLADADERMMLELYQNSQHPMLSLQDVSSESVHLAFTVRDVAAAREKLPAQGATVDEDLRMTPSGDAVLMLRDPWGLPIQFVKRKNPMMEA